MANLILPVTRIQELFRYDQDTGILTWRIRSSSHTPAGSIAGCINDDGYVRIVIDGIPYLGHRIAWVCAQGCWPPSGIDHINGNRLDNRLCNLRQATTPENIQNRSRPNRNNSSGILGVSWHKKRKRWRATIMVNRKQVHLGLYYNIDDARAAHAIAKANLHPFSKEALK